jgi:SAM-dependent methyltransferase
MKNLDNYINKEISFRFAGEEFRLGLSHGLFSSNSVDPGTMLLLKSLAKGVTTEPPRMILDAGCGTGILGICLKRKYPGARVILQDRDALAVAFSARNCTLNKTAVEVRTALLLETEPDERFDLVVSNIPAKAGTAVLEKFFPSAGDLLTPGGICAVVIVSTLVPLALKTLEDSGMTLVYRDDSRQHSVLHFRPATPGNRKAPDLSDYIRNKQKFRLGDSWYLLSTVHNVPDFDNTGFRLRNAGKILDRLDPSGDILVWSPGQGHLPAALARTGGTRIASIRLAGRDILELRTSAMNLKDNGYSGMVSVSPLPAPEALSDNEGGTVDLFVCDFSPVPGSDWCDPLRETALKILRGGGRFLLIGESQEMHRFHKNHKGLSIAEDFRNKGYRVILFTVNS